MGSRDWDWDWGMNASIPSPENRIPSPSEAGKPCHENDLERQEREDCASADDHSQTFAESDFLGAVTTRHDTAPNRRATTSWPTVSAGTLQPHFGTGREGFREGGSRQSAVGSRLGTCFYDFDLPNRRLPTPSSAKKWAARQCRRPKSREGMPFRMASEDGFYRSTDVSGLNFRLK